MTWINDAAVLHGKRPDARGWGSRVLATRKD